MSQVILQDLLEKYSYERGRRDLRSIVNSYMDVVDEDNSLIEKQVNEFMENVSIIHSRYDYACASYIVLGMVMGTLIGAKTGQTDMMSLLEGMICGSAVGSSFGYFSAKTIIVKKPIEKQLNHYTKMINEIYHRIDMIKEEEARVEGQEKIILFPISNCNSDNN